jgi:hypothetical protein
VLQRRPQPLPNIEGARRHIAARAGESIALEADDPIFAKIAMQKTWLGRLLVFFYRPPSVRLLVKTTGGREMEYRLVPEMAASGFLLSPRIDNIGSYLALALGATEAIELERVESIRIMLSAWGQLAYSSDLGFELITVDTAELQRAGKTSGLQREVERFANFLRMMINSGAEPSLSFAISQEGIFAHAPARLRLEVPAGRHRLTLGFGIRDGAWKEGRTDGVCFRVSTAGKATGTNTLFERCLRPRTEPGDRGRQAATVDLDHVRDGPLWFETLCINTCSWDWSYWSQIEID